MPILVLSLIAITVLSIWLANGWLSSRALAVAIGNNWEITAQGWGLLLSLGGPLFSIGLLIGLLAGILAGSKLLGLLTAKQGADIEASRMDLATQWQALEAAKAALDGQIQQAAARGRQDGARIAHEATQAQLAAEERANKMEYRKRILEGRLKGAQQKAARIQKKHS